MSLQSQSQRCKTLERKPMPLVVPVIHSLSKYRMTLSEKRRNEVIYIYGAQFRNYSFVEMGGIVCRSFYNSSLALGFYIPEEIVNPGEYSIQVFNTDYQPNRLGYPINTPLSSNTQTFTIVDY